MSIINSTVIPYIEIEAAGNYQANYTRGLFGGGVSVGRIQYISFASAGNATQIEALESVYLNGLNGQTRAIWCSYKLFSDYIYNTIASASTAVAFGNMAVDRYVSSPAANETRGCLVGGYYTGGLNSMEYISLSSTGNGTAFNTLSAALAGHDGCADATYGLYAGGRLSAGNVQQSAIKQFSIVSLSSDSSFGSLDTTLNQMASCSDLTYALFLGGYTNTNTNKVRYVSFASGGTVTVTGTLTYAARDFSATADDTYGIVGGGYSANINYISFASIGNGTLWGYLVVGVESGAACAGY